MHHPLASNSPKRLTARVVYERKKSYHIHLRNLQPAGNTVELSLSTLAIQER